MVFLKLKILQKICLENIKDVKKKVDNGCNSSFVYDRRDLMSRIIRKSRGEKGVDEKKIDNFRSKLGCRLHDITMSKEESVTTKIIKTFSNKKILPEHSILSYQIDLYIPKHKLAIEVDEKGHTNRDEKRKQKNKWRQKKNLDVNLLESILMQKIMIFLLKLVKYTITLLSQQINNQTLFTKISTKKIFYWQDFKNTIKTRI